MEYGGHTKYELLTTMAKCNICMNAYATMLFMNDKFVTCVGKRKANLVEVSPRILGFSSPATIAELVVAAKDRDLASCPIELAIYLRLKYTDQDEGPMLTVYSDKLESDSEFPSGLYLQNHSGNLWLRGYRASNDWLLELDDKLVFLNSCA